MVVLAVVSPALAVSVGEGPVGGVGRSCGGAGARAGHWQAQVGQQRVGRTGPAVHQVGAHQGLQHVRQHLGRDDHGISRGTQRGRTGMRRHPSRATNSSSAVRPSGVCSITLKCTLGRALRGRAREAAHRWNGLHACMMHQHGRSGGRHVVSGEGVWWWWWWLPWPCAG